MRQSEHIHKLPNAPLQEVIFEVLWDIDFDEVGAPQDSGYELAVGVFANMIKNKYPHRQRTLPINAPLKIYPMPVHQFWVDKNTWPVVQIGPGILAINDTDQNYSWEGNFKNEIDFIIRCLKSSYNDNLKFIQLSLRYIDAVELPESKDVLAFVNENFHIHLSNNYVLEGIISGLNINQFFTFQDSSKLNFVISEGVNAKNKKAVIWQTNFIKKDTEGIDDVLEWADYAHEITSNHFKKSLKPHFYDSFK
ncbi:MAG TPA: TIGR04255 family protein [Saprospiraceae bacterium]|nr:TIGR04255 family protein [Saprospiraceae bacterium]HMQ81565.1 TIGR04255 family protein [Saprospiraceae bacterium]